MSVDDRSTATGGLVTGCSGKSRKRHGVATPERRRTQKPGDWNYGRTGGVSGCGQRDIAQRQLELWTCRLDEATQHKEKKMPLFSKFSNFEIRPLWVFLHCPGAAPRRGRWRSITRAHRGVFALPTDHTDYGPPPRPPTFTLIAHNGARASSRRPLSRAEVAHGDRGCYGFLSVLPALHRHHAHPTVTLCKRRPSSLVLHVFSGSN